mmetsp:Transcript_33255/g.69274  ORF Transcript_33255/g.69274 Transcript_33255/m.69274 type:complete len:84 (+) Transcript_33255:72-323(+)
MYACFLLYSCRRGKPPFGSFLMMFGTPTYLLMVEEVVVAVEEELGCAAQAVVAPVVVAALLPRIEEMLASTILEQLAKWRHFR